jgi:hypothetical protein
MSQMLDRVGLVGYKVRVLSLIGTTKSHADD